jgi:DNA-binding transcriptional regulator/RsmH inhibitor MraZ
MEKDFTLIRNFIKPFENIVTTPNILTEACNLCLKLNAKTDNSLYRTFGGIINSLKERYVASVKIANEKAFFFFGISDTVIVEMCKQGRLLLTDDLRLYNHIISQGMDAINFNHIRSWSWTN